MLNRKFTSEATHPQKQPWDLTDEEMAHNNYHINKLIEANEANDEEARFFHQSQILNAPDSLMASKKIFGAQWIIDRKLDITLANRKFGNDWLYK